MLPIIHHPAYQAELPADHRFPMGKFRRLAERLVADGLVTPDGFLEPMLAPASWLTLAHDTAYIDAVLGLALDPAIQREIGFPISESVVRRARAATGGTILAGRMALDHGMALNTAGGSHHARRSAGAGFCVFNDVAVAASVLLAEGSVSRVLVIDLDVHQGDGTAEIFKDDPRVTTFSMHAAKNYPVWKVPSSFDLALDDGLEDGAYLALLDEALGSILRNGRPDIVFYNAGVDPHRDDRLGRLALSDEGIRERDRRVVSRVRERGLPLVGVLGGGYDRDLDRLVGRHASLFHAAADCL